jgi:hypothetical protein
LKLNATTGAKLSEKKKMPIQGREASRGPVTMAVGIKMAQLVELA